MFKIEVSTYHFTCGVNSSSMLNIWVFLLLDQKVGPDCCKDKLKARKDILRKYLDNNNTLGLEALFALQKIYVKYNKPAGTLQNLNLLYARQFHLV